MAYPQDRFINVSIDPSLSLLGRRRMVAAQNTIKVQLKALKETGRYNAFDLKPHPIYNQVPTTWPIPDHQFWDSDVGKWIEGACYFLSTNDLEDPEIEEAIDELIDKIRRAQHSDGYLNIHYSVVEPGMRFTNVRDMHELYNAGHLIEGALAHHHYYKNSKLLEPVCRYVDLLCEVFGPKDGQIHGYPGHPEIELALIRLFERTKIPRYLELASYFITERGNPTGVEGKPFYTVEAARRGHHAFQRPDWWPEHTSAWYCQAHEPIRDQSTVEGHAVRAMYLYTATSDLVQAQQPQHPDLASAMSRLWSNMIGRKMYVTGGVGAMKQWEGFGQDYFLPQSTDEGGCYAETCAAIGMMMWAERLLQSKLSSEYTDIMELALYNAVLTAMSANGKAFTYVNQLGSSDQTLSAREEWFTICCCPPNILRLLGHIGGYMFSRSGSETDGIVLNIHLYTQSTLTLQLGGKLYKIHQETAWPNEGTVKFSLPSEVAQRVSLRLRVPAWGSSFCLSPPLENATVTNGYVDIPRSYLSQDPNFTISFPMKSRLVYSHPRSSHRTVSVMRGPIVYCAEDIDNDWATNHFKDVFLDSNCEIEEKLVETDDGETMVTLTVKRGAFIKSLDEGKSSPFFSASALKSLISDRRPVDDLVLIPYHYRSNRGGKGQMRVGFNIGTIDT